MVQGCNEYVVESMWSDGQG